MPDEKRPNRAEWYKRAEKLHCRIIGEKWPLYGEQDGQFLAIGLGGEVGEVLNDFKKRMRLDFGRDEFFERVVKELADVRIYLELLAAYADIDLDQAVVRKLAEVEERWK